MRATHTLLSTLQIFAYVTILITQWHITMSLTQGGSSNNSAWESLRRVHREFYGSLIYGVYEIYNNLVKRKSQMMHEVNNCAK